MDTQEKIERIKRGVTLMLISYDTVRDSEGIVTLNRIAAQLGDSTSHGAAEALQEMFNDLLILSDLLLHELVRRSVDVSKHEVLEALLLQLAED